MASKRRLSAKKQTWAVDIPDHMNLAGEWCCQGYFKSKAEAIKWAQENLGADSQGRINVISRIHGLDEE